MTIATTWPEQLLERDPAAGRRGRGDELEAAPPRLGGERAREREDRPQAGDQREERAVLVWKVAAEGLDVDRLAGEALEDRRHGRDEVRRSPAATRAVDELGDDRLADADQDQADEAADEQGRPARVAERLAEDAAEPEDPPDERDLPVGGRGLDFDVMSGRLLAAVWPYWARNVSSSEGSRLTKSSSSYWPPRGRPA